MKPTAIAEDSVATIHYTLTLEDGTIADSSRDGEPMAYLHGHGNIIPGLEDQLLGRNPGEKLEVVVQPADGYGEFDPAAESDVPRSAFPKGVTLQAGMMFHTEDEAGNVQPLWVKAIAGEQVKVTANHPLAGRTLHFAVEVVSVRVATQEELDHGHPHGPGGHDH